MRHVNCRDGPKAGISAVTVSVSNLSIRGRGSDYRARARVLNRQMHDKMRYSGTSVARGRAALPGLARPGPAEIMPSPALKCLSAGDAADENSSGIGKQFGLTLRYSPPH